MFESYLTNLLSTHFGHLFTNISRDNVSISAWRGKVVLKDLAIRREALQVLLGANGGRGGGGGDAETAGQDATDADGYEEDSVVDNDRVDDAGGTCNSEMLLRSPTLPSGDPFDCLNESADDDLADGEWRDAGSHDSATAKCPFQIEHGTIGTFELHIPWSVLRRKSAATKGGGAGVGEGAGGSAERPGDHAERPGDHANDDNELSGCSLVLTDVNILITPTLDHHRNADGRRQRRQKGKRPRQSGASGGDTNNGSSRGLNATRCRRENSVQELLQEVLLRQSVATGGESIPTAGMTSSGGKESEAEEGGGRRRAWIGSLTTSILSSLTVTVRNVHIRYEDPGTVPAFGALCSVLPSTSRPLSRLEHPSMQSLRSLEAARGTEQQQHRPPFAVGLELESFLIKNTSAAPPKEVDLFHIEGDIGERNDTSHGATKREPSPIVVPAHSARHKLASATDLSAYWDSGSDLMCIRAEERRKRAKRRRPWSESEAKGGDVRDMAGDDATSRHYGSMFASLGKAECVTSIASELEGFMPVPHTYIVRPMSASLHFTMISAGSDSGNSADSAETDEVNGASSANTDQGSSHSTETGAVVLTEVGPLPPSRAVLTIPSCHIILARSTLEDIAYVRHSVSVWQHIKSGLLTESLFLQLTKIRPARSVREDPRAWWVYAARAIKVMSQLSEKSKDGQGSGVSASSSAQSQRRWQKGWMGLAQIIACRRRYTALYAQFLSETVSEIEKEECHRNLLELEDGLTPKEIVAFRMYLPSILDEQALYVVTKSPVATTFVPNGDAAGGRDGIISSAARKQAYDDMLLAISEVGWFFDSDKDDAGVGRAGDADSAHAGKSLQKTTFSLESKLEVAMILPDLSLEAIDNHTAPGKTPESHSQAHLRPIIRLICTTVKRYKLRCNGSWEASSILSGLEVIDLLTPVSDESFGNFRLLGEKRVVEGHSTATAAVEVGYLCIDKISRPFSASVSIRKVVEFDPSTSVTIGMSRHPLETTFVNARLAPLEAMYSTNIAQALSHFFDTAKTTELAQDYQRVAVVVANWRQRQRERLMQALSEEQKKLCANIDVFAPVLIIPQYLRRDEDCPALVIDLGRLTFVDTNPVRSDLDVGNGDDAKSPGSTIDSWKLTISDIQVLSFSSLKANQSRGNLGHPLVEPFALDFAITTSFGSQSTRIGIRANMPRLVFNFTSSAVRLVSRLRIQWDKLKEDRERSARPNVPTIAEAATLIVPVAVDTDEEASDVAANQHKRRDSSAAIIQFDFAAPFVAVSLSNDADDTTPVPLVFLVMRGISGHRTIHKIEGISSKTIFSAKLKSLHAIDLYQRAGIDYSLLLSSQHPDPLYVQYPGDFIGGESRLCTGTVLDQWLESFDSRNEGVVHSDLVTISYEDVTTMAIDNPSRMSATAAEENDGSKLFVGFNELYVEWNPETIAAMQTAMRLPVSERIALLSQKSNAQSDLSDEYLCTPDASVADDAVGEGGDDDTSISDDFYDALEYEDEVEEFHESRGVSSPIPHHKKNDNVIFFTLPTDARGAISPLKSSVYLTESNVIDSPKLGSRKGPISSNFGKLLNSEKTGIDNPATVAVRPFRFEFALSKLRVRFNKESRYRRLITAEMDETHLCYSTKKLGGGVRADASVGNLYLIDPAVARGDTMYGRILGLKTDLTGTSSLWQIKYETFPRRSRSAEGRAPPSDSELTSVIVDGEKGSIHGCDTSVELAFSPMRFVYLQQLWLEITDYFFEGILGYEVWGKLRPSEKGVEEASRPSIQTSVAGQQNNATASHDRGDSDQTEEASGNFVLGSDAASLSFLRFEIKMDSPVLILPVSYRSPHHMRISLGNMTCTNRFSGHLEGESGEHGEVADVDVARMRMQWYNNCHVSFEDFYLVDWEGTSLTNSNDSKMGMQIHVKWPIGPTAPIVIPKWNVKWTIDPIHFRLRRTDYALFQHFIYYNIGEESRHLDEWNALQDLSQEELQAYKNSIAVHFGYDKKDGPHTTYFVQIECERFVIDLAASEGSRSSSNAASVGGISCADLNWSMQKLTDRITKQCLTCGGITLEQLSGETKYSGFKKLLLPLQEAPPEVLDVGQNADQPLGQRSELVYESTSRPNGDNTKTLWIHDACIYFIYGAFMNIKDFFTNLPDPDVWTRDEISSSMQIGDRWYRIGGGAGGARAAAADVVSERRNAPEERPTAHTAESYYQPLYQFRLVLVSPRIVLASDPSLSSCQAVTLKMSHLDYFYENHQETKTLSRCFFIDGMELFTGLASAPTNANNLNSENSLIHPLCISLTTERVESAETIRNETKIATDVIRARAAYTDLDLAADVILALTRDMSGTERKDVSDNTSDTTKENKDSAMMEIASTEQKVVNGSTDARFSALCAGFDMLVIDDSKRHFANAQKLMELSLGEMKFLRRPCQDVGVELVEHFDCDSLVESTYGLRSLVLQDHLQPQRSRFRRVVCSFMTNEDEIGGEDKNARYSMRWESHAMIDDPSWGYRISPALLRQCDLDFTGGDPDWLAIRLVTSGDRLKLDCKVNVGGFDVQWNPSTVIAMQRFLGRFKKATKIKVASISRMVSQKAIIQKEQDLVERPARPDTDLRLRLDVESISLCLNKEHQDRRLVKTSIVLIQVTLCRDQYKSSDIQGIIGDISAWDTDLVAPIHESNRQILAVVKKKERAATEDRFLSFHYQSFKQRQNRQALLDLRSKLPQWVHSSIIGGPVEDDDIDYFLNVEFASLRMIHLRERTEEILDYLSNGLPGRGMGVTSKVAKGFIKERMKTRSFLQVNIATPHLFSPRDRLSEEGISIQLGDVGIRSWFEERNSEDVESQDCDEMMNEKLRPTTSNAISSSGDVDWYRVLSLDISGLGWEVAKNHPHRAENALRDPINLRLSLFKPSWYSNSIVVRGNLSHIDYALRYTDYVFLNEVMKHNLGKSVDKSSWDNVEKAYSQEEGAEDQPGNVPAADDDLPGIVQYAPNARIIRYGTKTRDAKRKVEVPSTLQEAGPKPHSNTEHADGEDNADDGDPTSASKTDGFQTSLLDVKFLLNGIIGKIIRDDHVACSHDFSGELPDEYEIIRLIVKGVEFSLVSYSGGKKSLHVSLYRIDLYDMGDKERLALEECCRANPTVVIGRSGPGSKQWKRRQRKPSAFSVLAEGYQPSTNDPRGCSMPSSGQNDPQIIISVESCPSSSVVTTTTKEGNESLGQDGSNSTTTTVARVVINYLSLCALMPPLIETAEFFSASWSMKDWNGAKKSSDEIQDVQPDVSALDTDVGSSGEGDNKVRDESSKVKSASGGGIHIKLVAQYPRIFFLADESEPHTRALVLRGLAVVNASKEDEVLSHSSSRPWNSASSNEGRPISSHHDISRTRSVTSIDANFSSMESYINPNVDSALGPNRHSIPHLTQNATRKGDGQELGIALIEPVTASFDFCRIDQALRPSSRTVYLTMEPVSTTLSFEDIGLLDVVLKRWSSERKQRQAPAEVGEDATVVSVSSEEEELVGVDMVERSRGSTTGIDRGRGDVENNPPRPDHGTTKFTRKKETIEFDVVFEYKKLGIGLRRSGDGGAVVESVQAKDLLTSIQPGDILISVGSKPLSGVSFGSIVDLISSSARPMTIHFQRETIRVVAVPPSSLSLPPTSLESHQPVTESKAEDVPAAGLQDHDGRGDIRSIMSLPPNLTAATAPTKRGDSSLRFANPPYSVSFSGKCAAGIQLEKSVCGSLAVVSHIDRAQYFEALEPPASPPEVRVPRSGAIVLAHDGTPSLDIGYDGLINMLSTRDSSKGAFSLTFLEADSECWPTYDRFDVQIAGMRLTLIDDINGRDMPVLRANMESVRAHMERGLHLETSAVELAPPLLLTLPSADFSDAPPCQVSDLSEVINRVHVQAELGLEYYNARIAIWEPFLEPQLLRVLYERQTGNSELAQPRPGSIAVEISDGSLAVRGLPQSMQTTTEFSPSIASVNLTDSAAEMLLRAYYEWRQWRRQKDGGQSVPALAKAKDDPVKEIGGASRRTAAAAAAAAAAVSLKSTADTNSPTKAVQEAALAALNFAQRRGASAQKKGDSAKPFVLRNRTGMRIAFVQQDKAKSGSNRRSLRRLQRETTGTGSGQSESIIDNFDFHGIGTEKFDASMVRIVEDMDEARFSMDVVVEEVDNDQSPSTRNAQEAVKRVRREYDGRFPRLAISLDGSPYDVSLDLVNDLPVVKVGKSLRRLRVRQKGKTLEGTVQYILVLWNVELENNRRVLTVSSAVSIASVGCGVPIEVGIKHYASSANAGGKPGHGAGSNDTVETVSASSTSKNSDFGSVRRIGIACPGSPCFLPLWLDLQFEVASVFVRPASQDMNNSGTRLFAWSSSSILDFRQWSAQEDVWGWKDRVSSGVVRCTPTRPSDGDLLPACLSFACAYSRNAVDGSVTSTRTSSNVENTEPIDRDCRDAMESISVNIGATLSLRNMLPAPIEWEVSNGLRSAERLDSSFLRYLQLQRYGSTPFASSNQSTSEPRSKISKEDRDCHLHSGAGAEVFSCDASSNKEAIGIRFKCGSVVDDWTEWVEVNMFDAASPGPTEKDGRRRQSKSGDDGKLIGKEEPSTHRRVSSGDRQVCVQTSGSRGSPLTFGVKIVPKSTFDITSSSSQSEFSASISGYDVIIFAELWIRNLTNLPLIFGAPSAQVYKLNQEQRMKETSDDLLDSVRKVAAEAALMELTSVLEFGDRGKGLKVSPEDERSLGGDVHTLATQDHEVDVVEEVFEYLEMDQNKMKRRWWASESHDKSRSSPSLHNVPGGNRWKWKDERWAIDCAGQTSAGWESCRNLAGATSLTFRGKREYDHLDPFRRRRWYRRRGCHVEDGPVASDGDGPDVAQSWGACSVFHHRAPMPERTTERGRQSADNRARRGKESESEGERGDRDSGGGSVGRNGAVDQSPINVNAKVGDGQWSFPVKVPAHGSGHGILQIIESRWPVVTMSLPKNEKAPATPLQRQVNSNLSSSGSVVDEDHPIFGVTSLGSASYEVCYSVSPLAGIWGEFTRILTISPRFFVRNDSTKFDMLFKQVGAPDASSIIVKCGETAPFHWSDIRLPELVCVQPLPTSNINERRHPVNLTPSPEQGYRWSGGFDICRLGMTALRIRSSAGNNAVPLRTIRAHVEIRPGTGSTGLILSLREEDPSGLGSLFRIENRTPFPIWVGQDGLLANPMALDHQKVVRFSSDGKAYPVPEDPLVEDLSGANGDMARPFHQTAFGLDVPFRQGKYAGREAASIEELLRLRVCLAPIHSRDGIESTKILRFSSVGNYIRLSPSRLIQTLGEELATDLLGVRIVGLVCADGPTRVLRFVLMEKEVSASSTLGNVVRQALQSQNKRGSEAQLTYEAAEKTAELLKKRQIPDELTAMRQAFFGRGLFECPIDEARSKLFGASYAEAVSSSRSDAANNSYDASSEINEGGSDERYSFRAFFKGFTLSIVDQVPSEIAIISLRDVVASAKWNEQRTSDALAVVSVGWLQIDNHCPNAPYPVALYPDDRSQDAESEARNNSADENQLGRRQPFLNIGLTFAPRHSSGIVCLRSVSVEPRDVVIAVDLAFVMRFQRFLLGIQHHYERSASTGHSLTDQVRPVDQEKWDLPDLEKIFRSRSTTAASAAGGSEKLYFEGLSIRPCSVRLSVAPSKALTPVQAALEGPEAASIHAAVRKGDVLLGDGSGVLGVKVGSTNRTAVAVIQGVFKSILVDALLRCDGASLKFSGVALRNYISTGPQLGTYLGAHYIASLRSNVPALIGSLSFFGNPVGLIRGLGDGVSDFVNEPVKGLKRSVEELDPSFVVDGVARGTGSLARHTVGGIADTASLLTETFSKNMAVLTLDRKYAQRRDKAASLRADGGNVTVVDGLESGVVKLLRGVVEGVSGVVRAPIRGAEKRGVEGFAKGIGKGLLGLLVKPVIGLSDAATDVMIGVKGSVEGAGERSQTTSSARLRDQLRPRRAFYGRDRAIRQYELADATAAALMMRTRLATEQYLSHCDMGGRVALMSVRQALIIGEDGQELLVVKFKQIASIEVRRVPGSKEDPQKMVWGVLIILNKPRNNGSEIEVVTCEENDIAIELAAQMKRGIALAKSEE